LHLRLPDYVVVDLLLMTLHVTNILLVLLRCSDGGGGFGFGFYLCHTAELHLPLLRFLPPTRSFPTVALRTAHHAPHNILPCPTNTYRRFSSFTFCRTFTHHDTAIHGLNTGYRFGTTSPPRGCRLHCYIRFTPLHLYATHTHATPTICVCRYIGGGGWC